MTSLALFIKPVALRDMCNQAQTKTTNKIKHTSDPNGVSCSTEFERLSYVNNKLQCRSVRLASIHIIASHNLIIEDRIHLPFPLCGFIYTEVGRASLS